MEAAGAHHSRNRTTLPVLVVARRLLPCGAAHVIVCWQMADF
jgi:hypothetical protein